MAVKTGAVATPLALVVAVAVSPPFVPPVNVPLAPLDGAVKVTVAPAIGRPFLSSTVAWRFVVKTVLIAVLCGVPEVAAMEAGGADRFVRLKFAGPIPVAVAVTL